MSVESELDRLAQQYGFLNPEMVVEEARPPDSPLHPYFDWDDSVAAEKWRREQAHQLIIRCRVTITAGEGRTLKVRRYTGLPRGEGPAFDFVPTEQALTSQRDLVLAQARMEMDTLRRKYEALIDFDSLLREMLEEGGDSPA